MIQDIFPKIYHNEYYDEKPSDTDFILVYHKNTILVRFQDEKLRYPTLKEMEGFSCTYHYLFSIDHYKYFLAYPNSDWQRADNGAFFADADTQAPLIQLDGYHYENIVIFRSAASRHTAFAGITGHHLFNCYQTNALLPILS